MRVLLIEDEATLADATARGLAAQGMLTDVARDGESGLDLALTRDYDVVVLDLMLPGRSGYDVCRQLRADGVWTPVLILSAKDGDYDQVDAFDIGADDYLTKPFSFPLLVAHLRALVRRGGVVRPAVLSAGDLTLDPASAVVARGDAVIDLSPREYALLHHLLRHKGLVVPRLTLLQSVWDIDHAGDDNVLSVYVGYLRRKIDEPFGTRAIRTVRGIGYRLTADGT